MKKVTQTQFYDQIGKLDVSLSVQGNYPYRTNFICKASHKIVGYAQEIDVCGFCVGDEYYLGVENKA